MSETYSCIRTVVFIPISEPDWCLWMKSLRSKHTEVCKMHGCSRWQIPEFQAPASCDHLNVARRTGHWTSATRQCASTHLGEMFLVTTSHHFRTNVIGLLSGCSKLTLRPVYTRRLLRSHRPYHIPSINSPRGFATKSPAIDKPFEEERLPDYEADQFYPASIGDTINSRYRIIGKLGYGANSTVWFCRELWYD